MAIIVTQVRPGDVISSDLVNQILGEIADLGARVTALEAAGPPVVVAPGAVITSVSPAGVRVGDRLTVAGQNFKIPTVANQVVLDQTSIAAFALGGSATQFGFDVPDVGVPPQGRTVVLSVSNGSGVPATFAFQLLPALVVPHGRVEMLYAQAPAIPSTPQNPNGFVQAGQSYIFGFKLTAKADRSGTYAVTPGIGGNWTAELLQDAVDSPRPNNNFTITGNPAGVDQLLRVRVNVPVSASTGQTLTVDVSETTQGTQVLPGTASITVQVNALPPTPETRVRPSISSAGGAASFDGSKVRFTRTGNPPIADGVFQLRINFAETGTYQLQASLANPTGWDPVNPASTQLTINQAGTTQPMNFELVARAAASATDFVMVVTRGNDLRAEYHLGLTVA